MAMETAEMDDRELLVELRVDISYIKLAVEELKKAAVVAANKHEVERILDRHEVDLNNLKAFRYWILGSGAAVSAIVTFIIEYLGHR